MPGKLTLFEQHGLVCVRNAVGRFEPSHSGVSVSSSVWLEVVVGAGHRNLVAAVISSISGPIAFAPTGTA